MWPNPEFPADLVTFIEQIFNGKLHSLFSLVIYYFLENATSQTFYRILNVSINIFTKRIFAFYISNVSTTPTLPTSHFSLSASVIKTGLPFFDINFGRDTRHPAVSSAWGARNWVKKGASSLQDSMALNEQDGLHNL